MSALRRLAHERRRDGAYAWGVFEDAEEKGRYLETFLIASWMEHMRQHERVTNADRELQQEIRKLTTAPPKVAHLVAA